LSNIDNAIKLYDLMAKRLDESGFAPHQAKVYAEMVEFMADCPTAEDAMVKIKNSPYYLAPSVALVKDKIEAKAKAAREMELPALEQVYLNKLKEIEGDEGAIYDSAYERTAQNIRIKDVQQKEAFLAVFMAYVDLMGCSIQPEEVNDKQKALADAFGELEKLGADFGALAKQPTVRRLVPVSDDVFSRFTKEALELRASLAGVPVGLDEGPMQEEWKRLMEKKDAIQALGRECLPNVGFAECLVIPPSDANGVYTYGYEEREA